jgi:signal transduction histidine kinase
VIDMGRSDGRVGRVDVAVAAGVAVWGVGLTLLFPVAPTALLDLPAPVRAALALAAAVALLWRRAAPLASALAVAAVTVAWPAWAPMASAYAVGAYGRGRARTAAGLAALVAAWAAGAGVHRMPTLSDQLAGPGLVLGCGLLGLWTGARRRLVAAQLEQARGDERVRLAAEMHDVVTHRVTLMVLQAGALRSTAPDTAVRQAADDIRATGDSALAELRDLVGVLRDGRPPWEPRESDDGETPAALVAGARAAGMTVRLDESGDPAPLAPTVRRTLNRVVQEGLSNAARHAAGAAVDVTVRYAPSGARTRVRTGPAATPVPPDPGSGSGLAGLRHRVEVVGGTLRAGRDGGGFVVEAELPCRVPAGRGEPR